MIVATFRAGTPAAGQTIEYDAPASLLEIERRDA